MRVLVCGGRNYNDRRSVYAFMDAHHAEQPIKLLIAGGARGADNLAADWAVYRQVPKRIFPAQWEQYGKRAGPMRNQQMLEEGKPDLVIAFPGGRGTADMIRRATAAGVPVAYGQSARDATSQESPAGEQR